MHPLAALLLAAGLLVAAIWVFARVRADYAAHGCLSPPVMVLQTGYFCLYALTSYIYLDARLSMVSARGLILVLAVLFMISGIFVFAFALPLLGRRSFGGKVGALRTSGIYRYSRNPQLVGSFLFIIGYAMLWPTWIGMLWAALWLPISHLMVSGEEDHLRRMFGEGYLEYCRRTPRYVGLPRP